MLKRILNYINIILELSKIKITSFVALSTFAGYVVFSKSISLNMVLPIFGVFLLACGSSALNQYQERDSDALMNRTKGRPIPSGRISSINALIISLTMIFTALVIIYLSTNLISVLLGALAVIWYNFIYTPLKKKFALAVVPGSVIGALPPMIGYTSAGGSPFDYQILSLALFFFIWQIPHFWLLLLILSNDYERANFPTLTKIFSDSQLSRITFIWIIALSVSSFLFFIPESSHNIYSLITMIFLALWLIIESSQILRKLSDKSAMRAAFIRINLYVLAVIAIISIDKLLLTEI
ncbi:MAG: protoheme IX farnesyltransferase [Melioribacteraceae bacterium]